MNNAIPNDQYGAARPSRLTNPTPYHVQQLQMQMKDTAFDGQQIMDHSHMYYQNHSPHLSDPEISNTGPFPSRSSPLYRQQDFYDDRSVDSSSVTFPVNMKRPYLDHQPHRYHHQQQEQQHYNNNPDLLYCPSQQSSTSLLDFRYKPSTGSAPANVGYSHMQQHSFGEPMANDEGAAAATPLKHSVHAVKAELIENYEEDFAAQAK
ncbi:hypothetical protein EC973_008982 [Apophysomyces ossiformis]|uniref:Uncharacterized protein n=1 Tax=Apophysomyces ossiformis TaxID=679940 RepID=A0A8H7BKH2_9FUNG|nr:hypothetical protein EC973_008982 [Apophysomyces ossiformis]